MRRRTVADGHRRIGQSLQPSRESPRAQRAQQGGHRSKAQRYPQDLHAKRIGAPKDALFGLAELHLPALDGRVGAGIDWRTRSEQNTPIRRALEARAALARTPPRLAAPFSGTYHDDAAAIEHERLGREARIRRVAQQLLMCI